MIIAGKRKIIYPNVILSITNPSWTALELNPVSKLLSCYIIDRYVTTARVSRYEPFEAETRQNNI
jgi:hypothetical protein